MVIKETRSDKIFNFINYFLLACVFLICLYPLWFIIIASISNPDLVNGGQVWFWPKDISFDGYKSLFADDGVMRGYVNTLIYTTGGTLINLAVTLPAAYALSRRDFVGRKFFTLMFLFTMFFSGGLIPTFMVVNSLKLTNTIWALILPGAVPLGNVILLMNAFRGVPKSLEEAAMIDGGSQWVILLKVFLPVVKPTLAAVTLFTIVGHWNDYFSALVYITDTANYPLQTYIQLNVDITEVTDPDKLEQLARISSRTLNSAKIVVSTIPLLMIYPFMQKYFVSGIVVGSVKE